MAEVDTTTPVNDAPTTTPNILTPIFAKIGVSALWFAAGFAACMYLNRKKRS